MNALHPSTALLCLLAPAAFADWSQNASVGPFVYTNPANWSAATVNNIFGTNPTTELNVTFAADHIMSGAVTLSYAGSQNVIFRSDSATPRTVTLSGNWLKTAGGGVITLGTVANPLILDLNGATRTFAGSVSTFNIYAKITNSGAGTPGLSLNNSGTGYTNLYNNESDFTGPVSFSRRGGSFASIKNVGGGPSSLGAPTTAGNGLITVSDATSFGSLTYTGTGDTSDRNWQWNLTGGSYELVNNGSGKLTLSGSFTFNTASTGFGVRAAAADLDLLGVISDGAGDRSLLFNGGGLARTITLGAANTYSGATSIHSTAVSVSSLKNAGVASSLGAPLVGNATLQIGNAANAGRLIYTGAGDATDRGINLAGTTGGAILDHSGTGVLTISGNVTAGGAGAKTLTLQGSTTGTGELTGSIADNSAANKTSILKTGAGTWRLAGPTSFTGTASVAAGTLLLDGSHASAGLISVSASATLGGGGQAADANVAAGGALQPGAMDRSDNWLLFGALTLDSAALLNFELGTPDNGSAPLALNDLVLASSLPSLGGVLNVTPLAGFAGAAPGSKWRIFELTSGTVPGSHTLSLGAGVSSGFSLEALPGASAVYLVAVPEAASGSLAALAFVLLLLRRRG